MATQHSTRVRISQSGQITLPAKLRKQIGVNLGDYVTISETNDGMLKIEPDELLTLDQIMSMAVALPEGVSLDDLLGEARREAVVRSVYKKAPKQDDSD